MVVQALKRIDPEPREGRRILFVRPGTSNDRAVPMVEVKLDSRETALDIRGKFVQLKKNQVDLGSLHLANCVTLATRVRADILRALAVKLNNGGREYYVSSYNSRPVMHFNPGSGRGQSKTMTFTDAIEKHGQLLSEDDLGAAYRRCGQSFKGQYGQHFVVLKDQPAVMIVATARGVNGGRNFGRRGGRGGTQTPGAGAGGNGTNRKRKYDESQGQARGRGTHQRGGMRGGYVRGGRAGYGGEKRPRSDW